MSEEMLETADEDASVEDAIEESPESTEEALSVEDLAGDMGWSPKEQWRGDPEKWKPAATFLKDTTSVNKSLTGKVDRLADQIERMARTSTKMTEAALDRQRQEIEARYNQAFEEGDREAADKALKEFQSLPATDEQIAPPPETQEFMQRHSSWFNKDQEATRYAIARADEYAKQGLSGARQLAAVEEDIKRFFPDLLPKPAAKAPMLNNPGSRGQTVRGKGFNDLPKDAQTAALDYERRGIVKKEEYAKSYFEDQ